MKFLTLCLLMGCATGIRVHDLHPLAGVTFCDHGESFSFMSTDALGTEDEITVPAHEATHREQAKRYGSCEAMERAYGTTMGKLAIEAEAYAAGYCAGVQVGFAADVTRQDMLRRLRFAMQGKLPEILTDLAFDHYAKDC